MNPMTIGWAVVIAAAYVFWPTIGKWSGASGGWITVIVMSCSLLPVVGLSFRQLVGGPGVTAKAWAVLILAGVLNGAAAYVYGVKAADPAVPTGLFLATVYVLMILFAPLADVVFNHATISIRQGLGIALALGAVYLMVAK